MRQAVFQQDAAVLARRRPGWGLLLTLGLHLLLAFSWRIAHPPALDAREERVFELISLPLPTPEQPAPPPERARVRSAPPPSARNAAVAPAREPEAITVFQEPSLPVADPFAEPPRSEAVDTPRESIASRARRDAGAIDRALRDGKPAVPAQASTPWTRFVRGVEDARIDSGRTITSESYTTPDGQVIYRFKRNGRYFCRGSGFVRPRVGGAEGGGAELFDKIGVEGSAGKVRCPSQVEWTPE